MNTEEFKTIFDNHYDAIRAFIYYKIANEDAASDIAQDVFLKLWEKRDEITNTHIKALLYKIASNMLINYLKKGSTKSEFVIKSEEGESTLETEHPDKENSSEENMEYKELFNRYTSTLSNMPEKQRIVFLMHREEDFKYSEIAERLGISIKAVEKRMSAALTQLRRNLINL